MVNLYFKTNLSQSPHDQQELLLLFFYLFSLENIHSIATRISDTSWSSRHLFESERTYAVGFPSFYGQGECLSMFPRMVRILDTRTRRQYKFESVTREQSTSYHRNECSLKHMRLTFCFVVYTLHNPLDTLCFSNISFLIKFLINIFP